MHASRHSTASAITYTTPRGAVQHKDRSQRLARANRLPDAAAFRRVFDKAERSRDKMFIVLSRPNGLQTARLGLAVSKKHCKLAVARNRLKRLARESFRMHKEALVGLDLVVLNKPGTHLRPNHELSGSLERHWKKCRAQSAPRRENS